MAIKATGLLFGNEARFPVLSFSTKARRWQELHRRNHQPTETRRWWRVHQEMECFPGPGRRCRHPHPRQAVLRRRGKTNRFQNPQLVVVDVTVNLQRYCHSGANENSPVAFMLEELDHGLNEGNACYGEISGSGGLFPSPCPPAS